MKDEAMKMQFRMLKASIPLSATGGILAAYNLASDEPPRALAYIAGGATIGGVCSFLSSLRYDKQAERYDELLGDLPQCAAYKCKGRL